MLRVRIISPLPPSIDIGAAFPVQINLTNESGSCMHLTEGVLLSFEVLEAASLNVDSRFVVCSTAAPAKAASCTVATDSMGRLDTCLIIGLKPGVKSPRSVAAVRIRASVVHSKLVFVSPSPSPLFWPVALIPPSISLSHVAQPVTDSSSTDKKRRGQAFIAASTAVDPDDAGAALIESASIGCSEQILSRVSTIPIISCVIAVGNTSGSTDAAAARHADAQLQLVPAAGHIIEIIEQPMLVGPGFGSVVWDCAVVLCEYLSSVSAVLTLRGSTVCELGTGTAFVGICLAMMGATVVSTDLDIMLPLALDNVSLNAARVSAAGGAVRIVPHAWGTDTSPILAAAAPKHLDYIIASEVVYDTELFQPLLTSLLALTCPVAASRAPPIVILAARKRAGCELSEFLNHVLEHFDIQAVPLLARTPSSSGDGSKKPRSIPEASRHGATDVARACTSMSKTRYPPMIFHLIRKL